MKLLSSISDLNVQDVLSAGGKGASLGEMFNSGILVPPGFVILTNSYKQFLDKSELNLEIKSQLNLVNHHELESVEKAAGIIQVLILNSEIPDDIMLDIIRNFEALDSKYVAVRSSATAEDGAQASWAGELDSFLNTTADSLLDNIKKCWASLFTPRAIFYRFENSFDKGDVSVAVVVQKMVNSNISGIAFSVHPISEDPNQMIIEAGYGLGEAIVSGLITPDNYVLDKRDFSIIDRYISEQETQIIRNDAGGNQWVNVEKELQGKQKLLDEDVIMLANIVVKIEKHFGFPCDIEWAYENGTFYIVQSRPITALKAE